MVKEERILLRLRLRNAAPLERIRRIKEGLAAREMQLVSEIRRSIDSRHARAAIAIGSLNAVSPLGTLERGYAIVRDPDSKKVIRDATKLKRGDRIQAKLSSGQLDATVDKITPDKD